MRAFRLCGPVLSICAAAALLAGCGDSHASIGSPVSTMPNARGNSPAAVGSEHVLYSFTGGNDGGNAATGLALDGGGNLYGTTVVGGSYTCGTVFRLVPQTNPPWQEATLYNFTCYGDGKNPHGGVILDPQGNLDGTTVAGGNGGTCTGDGCGVVFQLKSSVESVLYSFTGGNDGFGPGGGLVFDTAGNLYGTTPDGGAHSQGVLYQVSRNGKHWREIVLHAFSGGKDGGVGSLGSLLIDASGNLFGVTEVGGAHGAGTVFELPATSKKMITLYAFKGTPDAASPYGGLVADAHGNLYGTTYYGGAHGLGTAYELVRNAQGKYRERVLYSFQGGADGSSSTSTLVFGASNELYGTTSAGGGTCDCGTIFKVSAASGKESVLHRFGAGTDGAYSYYGLTKATNGVLYGTTVAGGSFNQGTVFEFTP
jgi:uncharacterized repeat protein (TIGR03803 family)